MHGRAVVVPRANVIAPLYDPFWPPYYAVEPKQAEVFVDGYYAGLVGEAGHLRVVPGGHAVTLYLEGYRTITENVYVRLGSTFTLHENMERLETGEVSAPAPLPNPGPSRLLRSAWISRSRNEPTAISSCC